VEALTEGIIQGGICHIFEVMAMNVFAKNGWPAHSRIDAP
jgi:hypothetical protein